MYQAPKLNVIGDAREVVLGYDTHGADLDNTYFTGDFEYGDDQPWPNAPLPR
jgi:hypothetical protein